jgi:UrcA family protein
MFAATKTLSAVAAIALTAVAGVASAQEPLVRTMEVRYGDLDLAQKAGQNQLEARISRAANKVCTNPSTREVDAGCRWNARQGAKARVAAVIARASTSERYAAADAKIAVGAGN